MTESPSTSSPLNLTVNPATHGYLASVTLGPHPVNKQRSFTLESDYEDVTELTLVGLLNAPMDLAGTAGDNKVIIHLEEMGRNSFIMLGDKPLQNFYIKLRQTYSDDLWLEYSGELGDKLLSYVGPLILDPVE